MKFYHTAYKSPSTATPCNISLNAVSPSADRIGSRRKPLLNAAVALLSLSLASSAFAQSGETYTWTGQTGLWSEPANWRDGVADGYFYTADFSTLDLQGDRTVHLDTERTIGNLTFGDTNPSTAGGWLLDNNGVAGNVLTLSGGNTITVNALGTGKAATISANINSLDGTFTKQGDGTLVLAGSTNLNNQQLRAYGAGNLSITGTTTGVTNLYLQGTSTLLLENGAALTTGANGSYLSLGWALDQNNNDPVVDVTAIMRGTSTWNHTGGDFNVSDNIGTKGSLTLEGSASLTSAGTIFVSKSQDTTATLTVSGNSSLSGNNNLVVGQGGGSNGKLIQSGGTITMTGETWIGNNGGGNGSFTKTGGTMTANNWFVVGRSGGAGTFDFSGGSITKGVNGQFVVADGDGSVGTMNLSGTAALTVNNELWIGWHGGSSGTINMTGGTVIANDWVAIGREGGTGVLNLDGGTISKPVGAGSSITVGAMGGSTGTVNQKGGEFNVSIGSILVGEGGTGTWNMSGGKVNVAAGSTSIGVGSTGTWDISGGTLSTSTLAVGSSGAGSGTLAVSGNASIQVGRLVVGDRDTAQGTVTQKGGTIAETDGGGENQIGAGANTLGTYNMEGGTLSMGLNNFQIGANGTGVFNQTGGTVTAGSYAAIGRFETGVGTLNLSGGTFTHVGGGNSSMLVGEEGKGTLNVSGTGLLDITGDHMVVGLKPTGQGEVNLNGGTIRTNFIQTAEGSAQLNLNGGVLQARRIEYDFLRGFTSANTELLAGGVIVDTNGFDVGIYTDLDGTGGLTKRGQGSLTLNSASTYTGTTRVEAGTLFLWGSIAGSVAVANGAVFDASMVSNFSITAGHTLSGSGRVVGPVRLESGAHIAPGDLTGTLTLETGLSLSQNGGNVLEFGLGTVSDLIALVGGTFLGNETGFTDITISDAGGFEEGIYNLITWTNTTTTGVDLADFRLSGVFPNGFEGSLQLGPNSLQLVVIPEPSTAALLGIAGASFLGCRRRRRA